MKALKDELAGGPLAEVFGKAVAPFARKLNPQDIAVSEMARKQKLPLSPSAIFESKPAKAFEWFGDTLVLGKLAGDMRRKQLSKNLQKLVSGMTEKLPNLTDKGTTGELFGQAIKDAKGGLKEQTSKAYKEFGRVLREEIGDGRIELPNLIETAEKFRAEVSNEYLPEIRQYLASIGDRGVRNGVNAGTMTGKEIDMFQKQIWSKTYKKAPYIGGALWEALEKDLAEGSGNIWASLKSAKDANKLMKTFYSNPTVKTISRKYALGDTEHIITNAFRSGNIEAINQIKKAIPKETWDIASERFVQNMLDTAINPNTNEFTPAKFLNVYSRYRIQIKNVMPEISKNLDTFSDVLARSLEDLTKAGSSPLGTALRIGASGSLAAGAGAGSIFSSNAPIGTIALAIPEGFSLIVANSMRAPKGVFKKWLTTGFKPEGTKKLLRLGGRFVDFDENKRTEPNMNGKPVLLPSH